MPKNIQLTIPKPCHEDWDAMTPVDKGKFCGSCEKQVIDFSTMSDRQVAEFFKKPSKGSVCGRFMVDQLERDIEIPKKRLPWFKYFFSIALPAFFFAKADAQNSQKMGKVKPATRDTMPSNINQEYRTLGMIAISDKFVPVEKGNQKGEWGTVVDANTNNPLPGAQINLFSTIGNEKIKVNSDGTFLIDFYRKIIVDRIELSLPGYNQQTLNLDEFLKLSSSKQPVKLEREEILAGKIAMVECVKPSIDSTPIMIRGEIDVVTNRQISGRVLDYRKNPVPGARVRIKGTSKDVMTNNEGEFFINGKRGDTLIVYGGGFAQIAIKDWTYLTIMVAPLMAGEVDIIYEPRLLKKQSRKDAKLKAKKSATLIPDPIQVKVSQKILVESIDSARLKIYPNPVKTPTSVTIEWNPTEESYYSIELINQSGQLVLQKDVWIDADARTLDLEIPKVTAGSYFLVMTNKKNGKKFSEKIIIQ